MTYNNRSTIDAFGPTIDVIADGSFSYTGTGVASTGLATALPVAGTDLFRLREVVVRYSMRNQTCSDELQPAGCAGRLWVAADVVPLSGTPSYGNIVTAGGSTTQAASVQTRYRVLGEQRFNMTSLLVGSDPTMFDLQQDTEELVARLPGNGLVFRPAGRPDIYLWWRIGQPALVTWTARLVFEQVAQGA